MPKFQITQAHKEAADAVVSLLDAQGFDFTQKEAIMAGLIANYMETIVAMQTGPAGEVLNSPEVKMLTSDTASATVRLCYLARAICRARAPGKSLDKQCEALALGLVEAFAVVEPSEEEG